MIATFTIPKVLQAQVHQEASAKTKEAMGMISQAFQQLQYSGNLKSTTKPSDLTPYMNYISVDSQTTLDDVPGGISVTCASPNALCLVLHSGSRLLVRDAAGVGFAGTSSLHAIVFYFDPNGKQDITTVADGPGKAVQILLYYNGLVSTRGNFKPNTCIDGGCAQPWSPDPSWLRF